MIVLPDLTANDASTILQRRYVQSLGYGPLGWAQGFNVSPRAGVIDEVRPFLPGASFLAWAGLFAAPTFARPVIVGIGCALFYGTIFLAVAWLLFRRRDVTGA